MNFHTFGEEHSPVMLLIHGMLTPWQIWGTQIAHFCRDYYVIAVALDAHTEEERSDFVSIEQEAANIEDYLQRKHLTDVHTVCGISMGGAVAHCLWSHQNIRIGHLVLDGAPLVPSPKLLEWIMTRNYLRIVAKSRKRDPKTLRAFERDFLPAEYLESYLKIADLMTEESVKNCLHSVYAGKVRPDVQSDTKILFLHGTRGNEILSRRAAAKMQKCYPDTIIIRLVGCKHCEYAIHQPLRWIRAVETWLNK